MAEGSDIGSGVSRALDDSRVDLNMTTGGMDTVKLSTPMTTGRIQPTVTQAMSDVLKHETTITYVSVAPSATRGTLLYSTPIDPSQFYTGTSPSRVSWVSKLYRFWRGDIKFRFVFTKTILQQTKVLAVFVPYASATDPAPSPDNAFFYSHKVLMNPANETEWTLTVPFVSDRMFHTMGQPTGMLYVLLFQNLVVSNDTASDIYFSIFVAGDSLEFHEYVQLPPIAGANMISPGNSFVLQTFAGSTVSNPTNTGTKTFLSDGNNTLATSLSTFAGLANANLSNGQCIAATSLVANETLYNAATMRTIVGTPVGTSVSSRVCAFVQSNVTSGSAYGSVAFLTIYLWPDFSFAIASAVPVTVNLQIADDISNTYNATFPSTFTALALTSDLSDRLVTLERAIASLLSSRQQK
jgi:hypothetical protein